MNAAPVQTQKRREDARFVIGAGRYTSDVKPVGTLHLAFVRSPYAHAHIGAIYTMAARAAAGVVAVITGADLLAAGLKPAPGGFAVPRPDGQPAPKTGRLALPTERVRCLGEAVAAVVAVSHADALAAAELVDVVYEDAPAAIGAAAIEPDAPVVWDEAPDNIAFLWQGGDADAVATALQTAAHTTSLTLSISRVHANAMEPRIVLAQPGDGGRLVVTASHQSPYTLRDGLAAVGFDKERLTVRIFDVGGSFGLKMGLAPEDIVVAHAARALGLAVIWESTRNEAFQADDQARELTASGTVGFDLDHRITALRMDVDANCGAYLNSKSGWAIGNIGGIAGVYDIKAIRAEVRGYFSHTPQTAAYRGAGRPEATYMIERLLDVAASELGLSPFELRRRNLIPPAAMPYKTALVYTYDCGEFEGNMVAAAGLADLAGFEARRKEAAARGKLRGLGVCNCIEVAGGPFKVLAPDNARVSLLADGRLRVQTGSMSVGQGHETVFTQLVADRFGVSTQLVEYQQGDTDALPGGRGNGGSSALSTGGSAVLQARDGLVGRLTELAAQLLDASPDTITLRDGIFRSRDANQTLSLAELAQRAIPVADGIAAETMASFKPPEVTFPNGTHICEVEIDKETGVVAIVGYSAVEDIGTVLHPMLAEGQIQGGVAQGIGQALGEAIVYDESGQLVTGSFMDYQMPRAGDLPSYRLRFRAVPTKLNPLGAKGVGEAGTVGSLAATMNAINDALAPLGIRHLDMPATPSRVWDAINAVGG